MKEILYMALPKFSLIALIMKKPTVLVAIVPVIGVANIVVDFQSMWIILFWFFVFDLITGLSASYFEWRKSERKEKWFFGIGEGFSSDKAKQMGVKASVYLIVPLGLVKLQQILYLKSFRYDSISNADFELATISVIVFCFIEGFSIFHENLPKCGFNIWKIVKKVIGAYKEIKS